MWEFAWYADYQKRLKKFAKSNPREVVNVHDNLEALRAALGSGLKPQQIVRGWIRPEPMGVLALDASGPGVSKKTLRLYVFPDEEACVIHILILGDKGTQNDDIKRCKEFVADLRKKRESGETEPNEETTSDYE